MVIFITSTDDGGGKRSMREVAFLYKICPGLGRGYSIVRSSKKYMESPSTSLEVSFALSHCFCTEESAI
jgi:hypothetical protein